LNFFTLSAHGWQYGKFMVSVVVPPPARPFANRVARFVCWGAPHEQHTGGVEYDDEWSVTMRPSAMKFLPQLRRAALGPNGTEERAEPSTDSREARETGSPLTGALGEGC
jgi:hypothetical protein